MNLNKVFIIGRITADPELRTTSSGNSVTGFSIATNRYWTGKDGQKQEETEFHNVVVWGKQAETVNKFIKKGSILCIEGRLQTRTWEDKSGNARKTTEIIAEQVQFGPRPTGSVEDQRGNKKTRDDDDIPEIDIDGDIEEIDTDDIPF